MQKLPPPTGERKFPHPPPLAVMVRIFARDVIPHASPERRQFRPYIGL